MVRQPVRTYDPQKLEKNIQKYWIESDAYKRTKVHRANNPDFYFVDGPPYTTGYLHIGTAWNKIIKDVYIRYWRMKGWNVRDQPGYDMHGLPIEVAVEKHLEIKNKKEIETKGIDNFVKSCEEFAYKYQKVMTEQCKKLGVWMDWDNPYLTVTPGYIESIWWSFKKAYEQGYVKLDKRVLPWCSRCETVLAESEIEFWDELDPSIYVKFRLKNKENEYILIWTTTPWTLPGNLAVAVNPLFKYVRLFIELHGDKMVLITIEDTVDTLINLLKPDNYEILEIISGKNLEGLEYIHPLSETVKFQTELTGEWVHKVLLSSLVTPENTGIVHIAPGHGEEDFEIGKEYDLVPICPVDETGKFISQIKIKYANLYVRDANPIIIEDLKNVNALLYHTQITHRYGHCWRCKTPIIYRPTKQWFLRVSILKDKLLEELKQVKWIPEWVGKNRMYDWIANARDWTISRQRYWGAPLPIWKCKCGNIKVVGSIDDLKSSKEYIDGMDLHRPWIDNLTFDCEKCKSTMRRVPDIIDVWFDSSVCSWASLNYPKDDREYKKFWPARWIVEGYDQTRGWYYSQLCTSTIIFNMTPYQSVLSHGLTLDKHGRKMSKSSGTAISPEKLCETYGVDSFRFYMLKSNAPWEDITFSENGIKNANRTLNILWNVYVFSTLYMSLDEFDPRKDIVEDYRVEDRWVLSRLQNMKKNVTEYLNTCQIHRACREIEHFVVEDLSRLYIKLVRDRTWIETQSKDKIAVYAALYKSLLDLAVIMAPILPHISEEMYRNLDGSQITVHMCDWPQIDESLIDTKLESYMNLSQKIIEVVHSGRQKAGIKLRWPLKRIIINAKDKSVVDAVNVCRNIILSQTNTKSIEIVPPGSEWDGMVISVEPNVKAIGEVYKKWVGKIIALLERHPGKEIREQIKKGVYTLGIEGQLIKIFPNMVSFKSSLPDNILVIESQYGTIYLDTEITPELRSEAYAKELIRRIQEMRKRMNLDIEAYIKTTIVLDSEIERFVKSQVEYIARETRSSLIQLNVKEKVVGDYVVSWKINGKNVVIGITQM